MAQLQIFLRYSNYTQIYSEIRGDFLYIYVRCYRIPHISVLHTQLRLSTFRCPRTKKYLPSVKYENIVRVSTLHVLLGIGIKYKVALLFALSHEYLISFVGIVLFIDYLIQVALQQLYQRQFLRLFPEINSLNISNSSFKEIMRTYYQ